VGYERFIEEGDEVGDGEAETDVPDYCLIRPLEEEDGGERVCGRGYTQPKSNIVGIKDPFLLGSWRCGRMYLIHDFHVRWRHCSSCVVDVGIVAPEMDNEIEILKSESEIRNRLFISLRFYHLLNIDSL
jgi:hypothetical protein